jgi:hypothetical protein
MRGTSLRCILDDWGMMLFCHHVNIISKGQQRHIRARLSCCSKSIGYFVIIVSSSCNQGFYQQASVAENPGQARLTQLPSERFCPFRRWNCRLCALIPLDLTYAHPGHRHPHRKQKLCGSNDDILA